MIYNKMRCTKNDRSFLGRVPVYNCINTTHHFSQSGALFAKFQLNSNFLTVRALFWLNPAALKVKLYIDFNV